MIARASASTDSRSTATDPESAIRFLAVVLMGLAFLSAWSGTGASAATPEVALAQLGFENWTRESGLAGNWVRDIVEGQDGMIWIATSGGLSRFDGWSFVNYTVANTPDLPGNSVTALANRRAGGIWVGFAQGGVRVLRNGQIEMPSTLDFIHESARVNTLLEDGPGTLWVGTDRGLWRVSDDSAEVVSPSRQTQTAAIHKLLSADGDVIWVRTMDDEIWRIQSGGVKERVDIPGDYGAGLALGPDGSVITSSFEGVWRWNPSNDQWTQIFAAMGVGPVFVDSHGSLWFSSRAGLTRRAFNREEVLSPDQGLGDWRVRAWLEDRSGSLWVGTYSAGLSRFRQGSVRAIEAAEGLSITETTAVLARPDGTIWIASYREGLVQWNVDEGLIRHWTPADGLPGGVPVWSRPW